MDLIEGAAERVWREASRVLPSTTYTEPDYLVGVNVDWNPGFRALRHARRIARICNQERSLRALEEQPKDADIGIIDCSASITKVLTDRGRQFSNTGAHHLEQFLYEAFLTMNLAAPGSADFRSLPIAATTKEMVNLDLSSDLLEHAWVQSIRNGWPKIKPVPLRRVWAWLNFFQIGVRQRAESRMERALFALLHLTRRQVDDPATLIWLAHALEALYGTPKSAVVESLRRRICEVLEVPAERQKAVRKSISRFYDARSAFVHGNFPITHPHENEVLDKAIDEYRTEIIELIDFASAVVVARSSFTSSKGGRRFHSRRGGLGYHPQYRVWPNKRVQLTGASGLRNVG